MPTKRTRKDQGLIEGASFIDSKGKAYVVIDGEMVHVKPGWKKRLKAKAAK